MEDKFELDDRLLAHPGERYQAHFLDGVIAVFLFFMCMCLMNNLSLEGVFLMFL